MNTNIDLTKLQKDIMSYIKYYVECFYNYDLGMVNVRIFNVTESDLNLIEDKIFDFEEKFLSNQDCVLVPLVKNEAETRENYPELSLVIKEFENQKAGNFSGFAAPLNSIEEYETEEFSPRNFHPCVEDYNNYSLAA